MYGDSTDDRFRERRLEHAGFDDRGMLEKTCMNPNCGKIIEVLSSVIDCPNCKGYLK